MLLSEFPTPPNHPNFVGLIFPKNTNCLSAIFCGDTKKSVCEEIDAFRREKTEGQFIFIVFELDTDGDIPIFKHGLVTGLVPGHVYHYLPKGAKY